MLMQLQQPAIGGGNTDSNALQLVNLSSAAHSAPQNSPPLALQGAGWNQNNSTSETIEFLAYVSSQEVSSAPATGQLIFASSRNGNTPQLQLILTDSGQLQFQATASQIVPGATSLSFRNNANTTDNVLIANNGVVTLSAANAGALTLSGNGAGITFTGSGPNAISTQASQNLALLPGSGGNVGIGTTTPGGFLDVHGGVVALDNGAYPAYGIHFRNTTDGSGSPTGGGIYQPNNDTLYVQGGAANRIHFRDGSAVDMLHLNYDQYSNVVLAIVAGGKLVPLSDSTTAIQIGDHASGVFVDFDTTNHRVGIGTTAPKAVLHGTTSTILGAASAANSSADLGASQVNVWVDETNNRLTFQVKYSNGSTVKSGSVTLS
jgi:hypothetical protein